MPAVPVTAKVVAVDGKPVPANLKVVGLAERLDGAPGPTVAVTLRQPDGRTLVLTQRRSAIDATPAEVRERNMRIWARLVTGLLACTALLACSLLLALRRPDDPVAMLLAFAFVGMAATIDPPLQFWLWTDRDIVLDVVGAVFFYVLLIALVSFPDGIFVPRFTRWLVPLGIPLAIFVSILDVDEDLQGIVTVAVLLAAVGSQIVRFRREPAGIARQQIKWAGFGFAAGFLLVLGAVILAAMLGDDPSTYTPLMSLAVLLLFSTGMAVIALGLLIALLRFRLWEADAVITRSAAYAVVTLIVGVVWAASSDLVKLVITEMMGRESEAGATTVGAVIAAGIFSPTQSVVMGWTRRHFGGPLHQIKDAAKRLKSWGLTEGPEEIATRALAIIDQAVHPNASAIVLDMATSHEMIAVARSKLARRSAAGRAAGAGRRGNAGRHLAHRPAIRRQPLQSPGAGGDPRDHPDAGRSAARLAQPLLARAYDAAAARRHGAETGAARRRGGEAGLASRQRAAVRHGHPTLCRKAWPRESCQVHGRATSAASLFELACLEA